MPLDHKCRIAICQIEHSITNHDHEAKCRGNLDHSDPYQKPIWTTFSKKILFGMITPQSAPEVRSLHHRDDH